MHVGVRLKQHNPIRILDQEHQYIGIFAAQMQVHNTLICQQGVPVPIDAGPIIELRNAIATLDTFDDVIEFGAKVRELTDAREVMKMDDINRLGFFLDPPQPLPEGRSG